MRRSLTATLLFVSTLIAVGCQPGGDSESPATADTDTEAQDELRVDAHSFAQPDKIAISHISLDLDADFSAKQLTGRASLTLDHRAPGKDLKLDTRDLEIKAVYLDDATEAGTFELAEADGVLGRGLTIPVTADTQIVHIDYATSPAAAAVQWLSPAQTAGGEQPFLFTQSQAILARTWVPCQDTPAVRFTYDAKIQVPEGLIALMSAENPQAKSADGAYSFDMPQAIPSYLLALAIGDLEFRALGERTGVYAEPSVVDASAYEFADTEAMMVAVEALYGPYRWGRYDILVLPPSFPFGGMENPRLTFATPTILAGDRSLVALIAHELAHSWSGNLATNATWNDFWLNEGFTVYLERRIMEAVQGPDYADMLTLLGLQDLEGSIADLDPKDTHLHLDLADRDPDDGMTDIAYEKGYFFLRAIEEAVGRDKFDGFLRQWFDDHAFKPVTTEQFLAYLDQHLIGDDDQLAASIDVDAWVHGPGLPNRPEIESTAFAAVDRQLGEWMAGDLPTAGLDTESWTTHEWLRFLRGLPEEMSGDQMAALDQRFELSKTGNSEKLHAWLHHVIANHYEPGYESLERFLTDMGRRKFLQPLYQRMADTDDDMRQRALDIYRQARAGYHSVSTNTLDEILDWQEAS